MTLPNTGTITAEMINIELGRIATAAFSIDGAEERTYTWKQTPDFTQLELYVDGVLTATGGSPFATGTRTIDLQLGNGQDVTFPWFTIDY